MSTHQKIMQPALTINQRNLYMYFLAHRKRNGQHPCFVPKLNMQNSRMADYFQALKKLEEYKLISVDRSAENYTAWIMKEPTNT